jgi:hypothetical protein
MKKIKTFLEAVVVVTVVMAFIFPCSAIVTNINENSMISPLAKKADYKLQKAPINTILPILLGADIPAATEVGDEHTPSIVKDNAGNLWLFYVLEEDVLESNIYIRKSSDNGATWPSEDVWYLNSPGLQVDPVATIDANGMLWVAFIDEDQDIVGFLQGQDPSVDPLSWEWYQFDQTDDNLHHQLGSIATYLSDGTVVAAWCYIVNIVYPPYSVDEAATVEHNGDAGQWTFTWDSTWQGKPASYPSIGASDDLFFLAFEYTDNVTSKEIINVRWGDASIEEGYDMEVWKDVWGMFETGDTYNSQKPSIAGSGSNVVLVYQSDEVGNQDIMCSYSNNDGQSWTHNVVVVNTGENEENPRVCISGSSVYCLYTKAGNLYMITSENGGQTWEESVQINDVAGSVVNQWRTADIIPENIVWTDNRGDDFDIYYEGFGIPNPPGAPNIAGPSTGKPGQKLDYIFNAVDPNGDQVKYIIDWGDTNTEETGLNPSGQDVTVSHTYSAKGTYIIKAKAQDSTLLTGPEATKTITIPKSKALNLPIFKFLQNYQNLFQILKYLLGL